MICKHFIADFVQEKSASFSSFPSPHNHAEFLFGPEGVLSARADFNYFLAIKNGIQAKVVNLDDFPPKKLSKNIFEEQLIGQVTWRFYGNHVF